MAPFSTLSVLAGFFVRTAASQFDIEIPEELLRLLVTMARNPMIDWARRSQAKRRDGRRDVSLENEEGQSPQFATKEPGPVSVLVSRELIEQVRSRLAPDDLRLMDQRAEGLDWSEIAAETGV